ncbi:MAG: shikimate dehydrogenase [Cycloclasticus sp. symbiont of Poecilosclerida sp. M]|nr:MAG: shikimate dehydrogenase [Cycloclasticus sp. symbiont of Poecilosclerida sp. M]
MDRYAVFGFPIGHSLSPMIHQHFAEQTQQSMSYEAIEVNADTFETNVTDFFKSGGKGINCTVPLKELAFKKADELSQRARFSGAVNTLKLLEGVRLYGDNTDGIGLLSDLQDNLGLSIKGKRILVLGAGGAARGIIGPLLEAKPSMLWLANRTLSKAQAMEAVFASIGNIKPVSFEQLYGEQFDLVINATSASLSGAMPPLPRKLLAQGAVCYDLAYSKEGATVFTKWGVEQGAALSVDGLGMLLGQAAHAFNLWRGVMPDTIGLKEKLRP